MSSMLAEERRYWIPNPRGHRAHESEHRPEDGSEVMWMGKPAVVIAPPMPDLEDWVCDMCSMPILTMWGDEAWPVPMLGGYALCLDHFNECVETWTHDTVFGEVSDVPMGGWPMRGCGCPPCINTINEWRHYLMVSELMEPLR